MLRPRTRYEDTLPTAGLAGSFAVVAVMYVATQVACALVKSDGVVLRSTSYWIGLDVPGELGVTRSSVALTGTFSIVSERASLGRLHVEESLSQESVLFVT